MPSIVTLAVAALSVAKVAIGHTWIEQLRNLDDQGNYVGEYGYPRGMVSKTDPGFSGRSMNWELPAYPQGKAFIDDQTPLCHTEQRTTKQSQDKYPRLKATPGKFIAMRYMENGHITKSYLIPGKPEKGGTIFVYGTAEPKDDEKLADVLQWTKDGKGGDKRGVLLAANDFDDGRCYEKNGTPLSQERQLSTPNFAFGQEGDGPGNYPLFCETNAAIPNTTATGKPYTLYWVWQWNTAPKVDPGLPTGKDEYYTTCMDVDVVDTLVQKAALEFAIGPQQDAMDKGVSDFASRTALMSDAMKGEVGPVFEGAPSGTAGVPRPPQTTLATSVGAPFLNSTATQQVPSITKRPGAVPTPEAPGDDNLVTVTDTVYVTVTAPVAGSAPAATEKPGYIGRSRNSVKFRGARREQA